MRTALKCVNTIQKIPDCENFPKFNDYYSELLKNDKIKEIINSLN